MGIGNAIGSVTVNIGLIMGIALICMPAAIKRKDYLLKHHAGRYQLFWSSSASVEKSLAPQHSAADLCHLHE